MIPPMAITNGQSTTHHHTQNLWNPHHHLHPQRMETPTASCNPNTPTNPTTCKSRIIRSHPTTPPHGQNQILGPHPHRTPTPRHAAPITPAQSHPPIRHQSYFWPPKSTSTANATTFPSPSSPTTIPRGPYQSIYHQAHPTATTPPHPKPYPLPTILRLLSL